jgi:hypothetical protein
MEARPKKFDLNMEEDLLEAWGESDGIRELIANALDEQVLTETDAVAIEPDDSGRWHVRDYGRGLRYQHFTQGEDEEKLNHPDEVIGKFGVGLKDALAVLYRHGVEVTMHSPHNTFTVEEASKAGFDDVQTLHVLVHEPERPSMTGTDILLDGVSESDIEKAKNNFLRFSDEERIEATRFGDIYATSDDQPAAIYVSGLRVATEPDFLFSYNITNTTKNIRDALNRERSNVGRTAYTPRVKKILQAAESTAVAERLIRDLEQFEQGEAHDELNWKPIRVHAAKLLNKDGDVVFATMRHQRENRDLLDTAREDGNEVVTIPENVYAEIEGSTDVAGNEMRDVGAYAVEYEESFEYNWVDEDELTREERTIWSLKDDILNLVADLPEIEDIRISSTMRVTGGDDWKTRGTWQPVEQRIVIHRPVLQSRQEFAETLLHEVAHPKSGNAADQTREFEKGLTELLGEVALSHLESRDAAPASEDESESRGWSWFGG